MASDGWDSPRLSEDLQLIPLSGGPQDYSNTVDGPVVYVTVANDNGVLGYLWAGDAGDAAGYVARQAGGDEAYNAGVAWNDEFRSRKERGLLPSEALAELSAIPGGVHWGHVVPGTQTDAPDLAALKELGRQA